MNLGQKILKELVCSHPSFGFELKYPLDPGHGEMILTCSKCGLQKMGKYLYSPAGLSVAVSGIDVVKIISQPHFGGVEKYEIDGSSIRNI